MTLIHRQDAEEAISVLYDHLAHAGLPDGVDKALQHVHAALCANRNDLNLLAWRLAEIENKGKG